MSILKTTAENQSVLQARNVTVTDESRPQFALSVCFTVLDFEIENADPETGFALINAAIARANHYPLSCFLFATQINHRVRDRRIALDRIGSRPKKQVAGFQILQFERVILFAHDGFEEPCAAEPDILLGRIARHIADVVLLEHVINKARAIHSTVGRIRRAIFVIEIARGQLKCRGQELLDLERIILEAFELVRHQRRVGRVLFLRRSRCCRLSGRFARSGRFGRSR